MPSFYRLAGRRLIIQGYENSWLQARPQSKNYSSFKLVSWILRTGIVLDYVFVAVANLLSAQVAGVLVDSGGHFLEASLKLKKVK